jgi:hypothetical protein
MKNTITIHKKNTITRGADFYSTMGKRALNSIYYLLQKHNLYQHRIITIRFSTMRKMMNLEKDNRYVETIKKALLELREPIDLNNFTHPETGIKFQWFNCSVLNESGFHKDEKINEWLVHIEVSSIFKYAMKQEGSFTPLNLIQYANKFRTKYAMKLYEYLRSFGALKYIDISQKHMMKLLALDEKSTYKYYAKLLPLVERQLRDIAKNSDLPEVKLLSQKTLTKDKIFRIQINPNSKKIADKLEAETALEKLIKRF